MFSRQRSKSTSSRSKGSNSNSNPGSGSGSGSKKLSSSSAPKRLGQELSNWRKDASDYKTIERLAPVSDDDLFHWEAVINGRGLGLGYEGGRWLLDIRIPDGSGGGSSGGAKGDREQAYPFAPPTVKFVTRICAANVDFETGEVCLDLLKGAWTPAYTLAATVDAVWQMLGAPEVDSPLNVDIAALLRDGDAIGAEGIVRWYCGEWRYGGK